MKILAFLTMEYPRGGLNETLDLLPKVSAYFLGLQKLGHEISFVMPAQRGLKSGRKNEMGIDIYLMPRSKLIIFNYLFLTAHFMKNDLIFVMDDHWGALYALFMKLFFKIPYVHHHCFPMELEGKRVPAIENSKSSIKKIIKAMITRSIIYFAMRRADIILAISKARKNRLSKRGIPLEKIDILTDGTDVKLFNPEISGEEIKRKFNLEGKKVILCVTPLVRFRKPEILIGIAKYLKERISDFVILVVGFGNFEEGFRDMVRKEGLEKEIILTGRISHREMPKFIAAGDVMLAAIPVDELFIDSAATKIFEYLAMCKPVVASDLPFHREMVSETGCGLVVPFNELAFGQAVMSILERLKNKEKFCYKDIPGLSYDKRIELLDETFRKIRK